MFSRKAFPLDGGGFGLGGGEGFVEGVGCGPVTVILENMGKSTPKVDRQKDWISSLEPGSWPAKSLAGKPRTVKPESLKRAWSFLEGVVLGSESALRGDVDDEEDLAAVLGEGGAFSGDAWRGKS